MPFGHDYPSDSQVALSVEHRSPFRWFAVLPAFVVGLIVPGLLIRFAWSWYPEGFMPWSHWIDWALERIAEVFQSGADGYCAVYFPAAVAPKGRLVVAITATLLLGMAYGAILMFGWGTGYFAEEYTMSAWPIFLILVSLAAAVAGAAIIGQQKT